MIINGRVLYCLFKILEGSSFIDLVYYIRGSEMLYLYLREGISWLRGFGIVVS